MALHDINQISDALSYRDYYLLEEDEMGDNTAQDRLIQYLLKVLDWYYQTQGWLVAHNLDLYHPRIDNPQNRVAPDIAVFKDIEIPKDQQDNMGGWNMMNLDRACPPWVFESSSADTYTNDIFPERKVRIYGLIGVREYFAYDPNFPRVWPKRIAGRLLGWRYDQNGNPSPISTNDKGWMWSQVLESWIVPDGHYVRLYDDAENKRLTEAEAEKEARREAEELAKAENLARQGAEKLAKAEAKARQEAEELAKAETKRAADETKARQEAENLAKAEVRAREKLEEQLAELQRQLEELQRSKNQS